MYSQVLQKSKLQVCFFLKTFLVNQSFATGVFPEKLKLAKIIPVYKKNDKFLIENYRPISILPSISKVFEFAVHQQLYPYFISNNYLHISQYGFRKQHSTEHAVLEIVDQVTSELDKGNLLVAIFLDLSRAFDTLNHDILLSKLKYYGFQQSALDWFRSYLFNRSHYVEYDHIHSELNLFPWVFPKGPF